MKKILSVLAVAAAFVILPAQVGAKEHLVYRSAQWYDSQTNIAYRWLNERASVEARVVDNHTNDGDGSVNEDAIEANLTHIGHLVRCIFDTKTCTAQQ